MGGGPGSGGHLPFCANSDGNVPKPSAKASGYGEVYAENKCILDGKQNSVYSYGNCNPQELDGTVDRSYNNTFYIDGGLQKFRVVCGKVSFNMSEYQEKGYDVGSTVEKIPGTDEILDWARALLY